MSSNSKLIRVCLAVAVLGLGFFILDRLFGAKAAAACVTALAVFVVYTEKKRTRAERTREAYSRSEYERDSFGMAVEDVDPAGEDLFGEVLTDEERAEAEGAEFVDAEVVGIYDDPEEEVVIDAVAVEEHETKPT